MRVGEILHRDGLVSAEDLASALADQTIAGKRLCSLLVVRGVINADQAARALAEQFNVSAALTKHIEHRDKTLAKLLPAGIARQHAAIPLGRLRDGEIVICVRDPKPHMQATFERILNKPVLITVAIAHVLDPLIDATYPPVVTQELSVRFSRPSTSPAAQAPPAPEAFAAGTVQGNDGGEELDIELDDGPIVTAPAVQELAMPVELSLVDLDDAGVSKDYFQVDTKTPTPLPPGAGAQPRAPTLPPANVTRTPAKK